MPVAQVERTDDFDREFTFAPDTGFENPPSTFISKAGVELMADAKPLKIQPYFGGFVLETLTVGMYGESRNAIREYMKWL